MKFSEKLTVLRKRKGYSQEQLSLSLGVSRQTVYKWEAGINVPELDKIKQLAKIFDVSYDILLNDELDIEISISPSSEQKPENTDKKGSKRNLAVIIISVIAVLVLITVGAVLIILNSDSEDNILTPENCTHNEKYITVDYIKEPTCVDKGIKRSICTLCKYFFDSEAEATGHSYVKKVTKEPSCQENGIENNKCTYCHDTFDKELTKLGHSYTINNVTVKPSYSSEGSMQTRCDRCQEDYETALDPLPFNHTAYHLTVQQSTMHGKEIIFEINANVTETLHLYLYVNESLMWQGDVELYEPVTKVTFAEKDRQQGKYTFIMDRDFPSVIDTALLSLEELSFDSEEEPREEIDVSTLKILFVSPSVTDNAGKKECSSLIYRLLIANGCVIEPENMYFSYRELPEIPTGYDLYVFDGVAPEFPTDGALWLLNVNNVPVETGIQIAIDSKEMSSNEGFKFSQSRDFNTVSQIVKDVDFTRVFQFGNNVVEAVVSSFYNIIFAGGLSPVYCAKISDSEVLNIMMAGEVNGQKVILSTFDFNNTSLPLFVNDVLRLVRNMLQYSCAK